MSTAADAFERVSCARCGIMIDDCALCQREQCGAPLCYRCVRLALVQEVRHPHGHGG